MLTNAPLTFIAMLFAAGLAATPIELAQAQFIFEADKLVGNEAVGDARQGFSVALSAGGNTAIVGGHSDNGGVGAAWVFTRSGSAWTQQGPKLVGTVSSLSLPFQGVSVALSADGNTAIVGGPFDSATWGAAWVFVRDGELWMEQDKLVGNGQCCSQFGSRQGTSVALSADGNTALVGGPFARIFDRFLPTGAAFVFVRSDGVWTQQAWLVGSPAQIDRQGTAVALSADGNTAISSDGSGATWVFTRSGSVWTQQAKLVGTGVVSSIALSASGNTAILGGPGDSGGLGAAWIFVRNGRIWTQQGPKLVGSGAVGASGQGASVALSAGGNIAILGGPGDNGGLGAAWVFARRGRVWTQQGSKLIGSGAIGNAGQGAAVALSAGGNIGLIGGPSDNGDVGAAWVFGRGSP